MQLLKSKKFFLGLAALVLLVAVLMASYKVFSLYSFNRFTKELDTGNASFLTAFKSEIDTNNKIMTSIAKASDFGVSFSKEKSTTYTNQAKSDYEKALKDYKNAVAEIESKSKQVAGLANMPLWLDSSQKKFISDINAFFQDYLKARKADYEFQDKTKPIVSNTMQILNDTFSFLDYNLKLPAKLATAQTAEAIASAFNDGLAGISSLEKYTKADYKFEGQDKLASEFPKSYKEFAMIGDLYAQSYLIYQALAKGDLTKIEQLSSLEAAAGQLGTSSSGSLVELSEKSKSNRVKLNDNYIKFAQALDFFNEKKLNSNLLSKAKVLVQNNQNKVIIFNYLVELYSAENGEKYPAATTFSSLITALKSGNHFDKTLKYNESDFTYTSDGASYYELGYKDEISGKTDKVTVGMKAGTSTLGVSIPNWNITLKDKKISLEFANKLTNNSAVLCTPAYFCNSSN